MSGKCFSVYITNGRDVDCVKGGELFLKCAECKNQVLYFDGV